MEQIPWYRRLFGSAPSSNLETALARAEEGDADAQFGLGLRFSMAGPIRDLEKAAAWYNKAADQNHLLAQFNLSMMFASGQGVARDDAMALVWIRKAAEGGDAGAQFQLGSRYHRTSVGPGPSDAVECRVEAYKWFCLAANQDYHGSGAARERVTLVMSRDEVLDGNRRVAAFAVRPLAPAADVPSV